MFWSRVCLWSYLVSDVNRSGMSAERGGFCETQLDAELAFSCYIRSHWPPIQQLKTTSVYCLPVSVFRSLAVAELCHLLRVSRGAARGWLCCALSRGLTGVLVGRVQLVAVVGLSHGLLEAAPLHRQLMAVALHGYGACLPVALSSEGFHLIK